MAAMDKAVALSLVAQEKAIAAALAATKEAILKAEDATERRFAGVNEFRATLSDQAAHFLSREEFEARREGIQKDITSVAERVGKLEVTIANIQGRATANAAIVAIAASAVVAALMQLIFR